MLQLQRPFACITPLAVSVLVLPHLQLKNVKLADVSDGGGSIFKSENQRGPIFKVKTTRFILK